MPTGVVIDNGGCLIKAAKFPLTLSAVSQSSSPTEGTLLDSPYPEPLIVPNALAKPTKNAIPTPANTIGKSRRPAGFLVASEILKAPDVNGMTLRRPVDRGVVALWDVQRDVWNSVFSNDCGIGLRNFADASLLVTEPLGVPVHMRSAMDELVFEEFGFGKYTAVNPQRLAAIGARRETALVLDSGFSFSHAVPVVDGVERARCARRLNLGGKALTNHLKELVSFRSINMMDETVLINAIKERLCRVSLSYIRDLNMTKERGNPIFREYLLPDHSRGPVDPMGQVITPQDELDGSEQVLPMNNERIAVPELLFNPSDIGLEQAGVAELIYQAVEACPEDYHADLYANVVLTGGNCKFPNFKERVEMELRPLVSDIYDVNVHLDDDPMLATFHGAVLAMTREDVPLKMVSKQFYEENGSSAILRHFYGDGENSSLP